MLSWIKPSLIMLSTIMLLFNIDTVCAQNFCEAYKQEIIKSRIAYHYGRPLDSLTLKSINVGISHLRKTLQVFEKRHGYSILTKGTVYMVDLYGAIHYKIIWNGKGSCYYKIHSVKVQTMSPARSYFVTKSFEVHADASMLVNEIPEDCKRWILAGDTDNFDSYAKDRKILAYDWLSFTKAIRVKKKWTFISAGSYNITDYTLTPVQEKELREEEDMQKKKKDT